ncbi:MAG: hypothetical protein DI587_03250 [Variovorax paradoxus]|nr:MAG: hypothetical protein DI583_03250 [Variovorax paradoxus]PZQ15716.1 MAG: hypothetical protein DI587_03250 [Variovorax paradoxus]
MPELAKDAVALFAYLLPGFLSAWVLYGLTSTPKPSQFERVVEALIFTFVVHVLALATESALTFIGARWKVLGPWNDTAANIVRACFALLLGFLLALYTNTDRIHAWFRLRGITTRTSFPSEWFSVLSRQVTYVVLHLEDGRRLYGWPKEWPNEPSKGHFYIMQPCWIAEDGAQTELSTVDGVLMPAVAVKWVEFMRKEGSTDDS